MKPSRVPAPRRRLVIATANPGKLREFRALLAGLAVRCRRSIGTRDRARPKRPASTFLANALLKARHAAAATGRAAIADDSGLEVDALGGAPGVYSARYAGRRGGRCRQQRQADRRARGVPLGAAPRALSLRAGVRRRAATIRHRLCRGRRLGRLHSRCAARLGRLRLRSVFLAARSRADRGGARRRRTRTGAATAAWRCAIAARSNLRRVA